MRYTFTLLMALLSSASLAESFKARCSDFRGETLSHINQAAEPFLLNDGTTYEFIYTANGNRSLKYVIDGAGIIEPKKEDRWHDLNLLGQTSNYVSAMSIEGAEQILFSLYPSLKTAQIIWVTQPTKIKPEPTVLVLKANCEFTNE